MLCITKIECDDCKSSFIITLEQTIGEQLEQLKSSDIKWEDCFTIALDEYIDTREYGETWKEYLYELTYVKQTTHHDMQIFVHDDSEWDLMAEKIP